jgi:penicillin amidase
MEQRAGKKVSIEDARQMQLDTVSPVAERWVPRILNACTDPELSAPVQLLQPWDFRVRRQSQAATLFNAFYSKMMGNTLADETGKKLWDKQLRQSYIYYVPDLVLARIHDDNKHYLYDNIHTKDIRETRDMIIEKSMHDAVSQISEMLGKNPEKWKWQQVHTMHFEHPLGSKLSFFNLDPIPTDGSHHTINSGFWDNSNPFKMDSGGVIRMVVDFADIKNSTIISPPGQSGHYKSPHYSDTAEIWADGRQVPMNFDSYENLPKKLLLKPVVKG